MNMSENSNKVKLVSCDFIYDRVIIYTFSIKANYFYNKDITFATKNVIKLC